MDTFVVGCHLRPKIGEKNVHENSLENWKIDLMLVILITHSALPLIIKSKLY